MSTQTNTTEQQQQQAINDQQQQQAIDEQNTNEQDSNDHTESVQATTNAQTVNAPPENEQNRNVEARNEQASNQRPPALPRLFALFPLSSYKWRFIKVDSENIKSFFVHCPRQIQDETKVDYTRRLFSCFFNFKKLNIIDGLQALVNLPNEKHKMFLNSIYTDGFTCRVLFARRTTTDPIQSVKLEIEGFNLKEIEENFKVCTVDPGRRDVYVSYHGNNDLRKLSTKEYYEFSGTVNRMKKEEKRKVTAGIKEVEINIPSAKTQSSEQFLRYMRYTLLNMPQMFNFYNLNTAKLNWKNYQGRQKALDFACNIFIYGTHKYNKSKQNKKKDIEPPEKKS